MLIENLVPLMKEKFVSLPAILHLTAPSCSIIFTDGVKLLPDITLFKIDPLPADVENYCCFVLQTRF